MFDYGQLDVVVEKTSDATSGATRSYTWKIMYLTMLDVWQSQPDSGPNTGRELTVLPPASSNDPQTLYNLMAVTRRPYEYKGVYPVSFTLWHTGAYLVRITNNGIDIAGSPLTIQVSNAALDASASWAVGSGLQGGVAGQQLAVSVQAMDKHTPDVQTITTSAITTNFVPEIQQISIPYTGSGSGGGGWSFDLSFRGYTVSGIGLITDAAGAGIATAITTTAAAPYFGTVVVTGDPNSIDTATGYYQKWFVTFMDLTGPLPLMTSTQTGVTISKYRAGDAPYRRAIQVLMCNGMSLAPATTTFTIGAMTSTPVLASDTLTTVAQAWGQLGYGSVSITSPTATAATSLCLAANTVLFVSFDNAEGDVPPVVASDTTITISTNPSNGALSGIFPLWGTYTLGINGETTAAIPLSASADDLQTILGNLYSLRDIVVTKDVYGVPYQSDSSLGQVYKNPQTVFSVYTITFRSSCFDATGMVMGGFCATYTGDESLFTVDPSNVQYSASPYINQERPTISVRKNRKGYMGNARIGSFATTDLSALSMTLVPVNATAREGTEQLRSIGMTVKQMLHCTASGAGAPFSLVVVNDTIQVHSWFAAGDLQKALNPGTNLPSNDRYPLSPPSPHPLPSLLSTPSLFFFPFPPNPSPLC